MNDSTTSRLLERVKALRSHEERVRYLSGYFLPGVPEKKAGVARQLALEFLIHNQHNLAPEEAIMNAKTAKTVETKDSATKQRTTKPAAKASTKAAKAPAKKAPAKAVAAKAPAKKAPAKTKAKKVAGEVPANFIPENAVKAGNAGQLVRFLLLQTNKDTDAILADVAKRFPERNYDSKSVSWHRWELRKVGHDLPRVNAAKQ